MICFFFFFFWAGSGPRVGILYIKALLNSCCELNTRTFYGAHPVMVPSYTYFTSRLCIWVLRESKIEIKKKHNLCIVFIRVTFVLSNSHSYNGGQLLLGLIFFSFFYQIAPTFSSPFLVWAEVASILSRPNAYKIILTDKYYINSTFLKETFVNPSVE